MIGHWIDARWGRIALAAAFGITVYWTITCLAAIVAVRGAPGWLVPSETPYWVVLLTIAAWGAWALWHIFGESRRPAQEMATAFSRRRPSKSGYKATLDLVAGIADPPSAGAATELPVAMPPTSWTT